MERRNKATQHNKIYRNQVDNEQPDLINILEIFFITARTDH